LQTIRSLRPSIATLSTLHHQFGDSKILTIENMELHDADEEVSEFDSFSLYSKQTPLHFIYFNSLTNAVSFYLGARKRQSHRTNYRR
jgi:hypothetical protein